MQDRETVALEEGTEGERTEERANEMQKWTEERRDKGPEEEQLRQVTSQ